MDEGIVNKEDNKAIRLASILILIFPENLTLTTDLLENRILSLQGLLYHFEDIEDYEMCQGLLNRIHEIEDEISSRKK